jgi:hypothetical protein
MHWTAGFRVCYKSDTTGPPPVMSIVRPDMSTPAFRTPVLISVIAAASLVGGYAPFRLGRP